jgi:hypothetical protein
MPIPGSLLTCKILARRAGQRTVQSRVVLLRGYSGAPRHLYERHYRHPSIYTLGGMLCIGSLGRGRLAEPRDVGV